MKINRGLPSMTIRWVAMLSLVVVLSLALLPQSYEAAEAALVAGPSVKDTRIAPKPLVAANQETQATFGDQNDETMTGPAGGGGDQVIKIGSNVPLPPIPENF
ncbi:hypothetical protein EMPS_06496 [Entomortierella parvispora]|uniref:Secreted protein n=1 Tax=Entomortierella parvispora TaxID=205924 RepID=A0A9P3LXI8_9FUNG|nr:hypothetical protein EMPS_06496 [Entomortierella parvispora]